MKIFLTAIFFCNGILLHGQYNLKIRITTEDSVLAGASVFWQNTGKSFITDSDGMVDIENITTGKHRFVISYVGFEEKKVSYIFPLDEAGEQVIVMEPHENEEEEVIVSATRTSRTIENAPTRVEIISGEELDEKGNMKPGDIRMLLNESTGIQTQQTSAISYNSSIRIQGLDGRYTQILKDGYPLYSGFSGGLSIMQLTPLDLRQVEVIKGSSSTLYGGGAIAGLVNMVSRTPGERRELNFIANATSARGLDLSSFYSEKFNNLGISFFGSANFSSPYDPADIGLTAIPKYKRYTINPRLFFYGKRTMADLGISYITEDRTGGNLNFIKHRTPGYFEENNTDRITAQFGISHKLNERAILNFKNSFSHFNRSLRIPFYHFEGVQRSFFSEFSYSAKNDKAQWVAGINFLTDDFNEEKQSADLLRNYHYNTIGAFVQNTFNFSDALTLETGLRGDVVSRFEFELLPRFSALLRINPKLTSRIGGGMGYKTPTVFNEESERFQFVNVLSVNEAMTENEKSIGGNIDFNYTTTIGRIGLSINQLFFYTRLNKPLVLETTQIGEYQFINAMGYLDTKGLETNLKLTYSDFKLFIGYTHADVNSHIGDVKSWYPLTAKHRLNNVLMYEIEDKLKLGLEAYYFSPQKLTDARLGRSYWIAGFMAEKLWEKYSVFINFENFGDTRQTKWDVLYTGTIDNPVFKDIYAPVDGFVINGGIKIKL